MLKILVFAAFLFQGEGAPEPGKPLSCDNYYSTAADHRCACGKAMHSDCSQREPNVAMDKQCKTYCREQNCRCVSKCTT